MSCVPFVFQTLRFLWASAWPWEAFLETLPPAVWTLYSLNNLTTLNYFKKKLYDFHNLLLILMG